MQSWKLRNHAVVTDTSLPQNVLQLPHSLNYNRNIYKQKLGTNQIGGSGGVGKNHWDRPGNIYLRAGGQDIQRPGNSAYTGYFYRWVTFGQQIYEYSPFDVGSLDEFANQWRNLWGGCYLVTPEVSNNSNKWLRDFMNNQLDYAPVSSVSSQ